MELWPFIPQRGMTESLEWLTDVIRCKAGEDRVALRHLPRQAYQVSCLLSPDQYGRAKVFSRTQSQDFLLPMWQHYENVGTLAMAQELISGDFDLRFFGLGQQVVVWESAERFMLAEVINATQGELKIMPPLDRVYNDACVLPVQQVRWAQAPDYNLNRQDKMTANLVVRAIAALELTPSYTYPQYRGLDVLLDDNILISDLAEGNFRELDEVDNGSGIVAGTELYSTASMTSMMNWHPLNRAERLRTLEWIHSRRGRRRAFWYRSHNSDLAPTTGVGPNPYDAGFDRMVVNTAIQGIAQNVPFDIMVEHTNGSRRFYRCSATAVVSGSQTALRLSPATGTTWTLPEIRRVSFLTAVRFDSDRVEINYTNGGAATVSMPIVEVPGA